MTIEKAQQSDRTRFGLSRRPLTASRADQALFVNRAAEADTILKAVDLGLNSFVSGLPGSGKTSLLRHVQATLEAQDRPVIYVNVGTVASVEAAIAAIAEAIDPAGATGSPSSPGDETAVGLIEEALGRRGDGEPVVVLVDGVDADVTAVLFGRYRDRLWESPQVRWVVASRDARLAPPADAFFDRVVPLGPLSTQAAAELLERRAGWIDETTRAELVDAVGPAQPVLWMLAAQSIAMAGEDPAPVIDALASQRAAAENLPERLAVLYEALVDLGPVHAGDPKLLDRVGASRPWVVTGLKELEEQGLVRSQRHGRRVLYETVRTGLLSSFDSAMHSLTDARGEG